MDNHVLGLEVDGPPSEWMPVKVLGSGVFMNQEGHFETWHFESDNIQNWEALGLLTENMQIRKESCAPLYFGEWEEEDEDIDD